MIPTLVWVYCIDPIRLNGDPELLVRLPVSQASPERSVRGQSVLRPARNAHRRSPIPIMCPQAKHLRNGHIPILRLAVVNAGFAFIYGSFLATSTALRFFNWLWAALMTWEAGPKEEITGPVGMKWEKDV